MNETVPATSQQPAQPQPEQQPQPQAPRFKTEAERTASLGIPPGAFAPPASPDDYVIQYRDENGAPMQLDETMRAVDVEVRATAHALGLTAAEVAHINEVFSRPGAERLSNDQCEARLTRLWGGNYQANMRAIAELVGEHATPAMLERIEASGLGNSIELITALHNAASRRRK
jgi:hypothetical protein